LRRFLYDTSIFIYAFGGDHPYRDPCREIVHRATAGVLQGEASVDLLQEFAHQRIRRTGERGSAGQDHPERRQARLAAPAGAE